MGDIIKEKILDILSHTAEPLETKEIELTIQEHVKTETITRTKIFYRLNLLRGEGKIKGKFTGPGKGVWIWWGVGAFSKKEGGDDN